MHKKFLLIIAFISGLSIMAMEISSARLLAPYFGSSLFVWTNIIGVVLTALAIGYYLGGKFADRKPFLKPLLTLILIAGLLFLITPELIKPVSGLFTSVFDFGSASTLIFAGSLGVTFFLFGFPLVLLGMVSPFIIKLYSLSLGDVNNKQVGSAAGTVFAVSTVGSILGTFLPTLLFIPVFGTKITISFFSLLLVLMAIFGLLAENLNAKKPFLVKKYYLFILLILILPLAYIGSPSLKTTDGLIFETESAYQYIQVVEDDNSSRHMFFDEGRAVQSFYNPYKIFTDGLSYYDYFNLLPYLVDNSDKKQVLIIGLAGGTMSRQLDHFFRGELAIDGVEIDKKVIEVAEKYFELNNPSLKVYNEDGRIFLKNSNKKYDIIIVDAYTRAIYIPWTLTTQEFWQLVEDSLKPGGIVGVNVADFSENPDLVLLQTMANTMAKVFNYVYIGPLGIMSGNNVLPLQDFPELVNDARLTPLAKNVAVNTSLFKYKPELMIFTDDRAPVKLIAENFWKD